MHIVYYGVICVRKYVYTYAQVTCAQHTGLYPILCTHSVIYFFPIALKSEHQKSDYLGLVSWCLVSIKGSWPCAAPG